MYHRSNSHFTTKSEKNAPEKKKRTRNSLGKEKKDQQYSWRPNIISFPKTVNIFLYIHKYKSKKPEK